jgi:uncharacterized protein
MLYSSGRSINFVRKISKFCNLRCSYCYEFEELANRRRMGIEELRALFINIRDGMGDLRGNEITFIWHGGEPFLVPVEYYDQIGEVQCGVFGDSVRFNNMVQTNLTVLTQRHIEFLKERRFFRDGVGVSFDVVGDQRVDTRGRLKTQSVLANLQKLIDAGIPVGAIAVLARNTLPHIEGIYRFYDALGVPVQVLPFYKSASDGQIEQHSLSFEEIASSFKRLFDAWLSSSRATRLVPIDEYLGYALAVLAGRRADVYDPGRDEHSFLVDTDGTTYGTADTYDDRYAYGNLFKQELRELLASPARSQAAQEARARMGRCGTCPYFGYCPGTYAADATVERRRMLAQEGCPVRELIAHIVQRLEHERIDGTLIQRLRPAARRAPGPLVDA